MGDRLLQVLAGQAQPVRLYSPNPDAPQWAGLPPTPEEPRAPLANRLWNAVKNAPGQLWGMLPPEARNAYTSGAQAVVDMTTPAAVRDYTTSAQDTARSAMQGDGWGAATGGLGMVNAALGAIPIAGMGVRAAQKVGMGAADAVAPAGRLMRGAGDAADTMTGWVFRDVASPNGKMAPGDWRKRNFALDTGDVQNVELPISSMYATQGKVNPDFRAAASNNQELPVVLKKDGNYYLQDGHHRIMATAAEGKQTAPVRLIDIDGTTQTDFPLLEILRKYGLLPFAGAAAAYGASQGGDTTVQY